jgi:hypothetical protein
MFRQTAWHPTALRMTGSAGLKTLEFIDPLKARLAIMAILTLADDRPIGPPAGDISQAGVQ